MKEKGIEYQCFNCGIVDTWQGKSIRLEVDHIDGDCLNNLKVNLRFACPNCHTQTKTYKHG